MSWWTDREPFDEYDPPYCKDFEKLYLLEGGAE